MTQSSDFMDFINTKSAECLQTWSKANAEYATVENPFSNFEEIATFLHQCPELSNVDAYNVASIYLMKHIFPIVKGFSTRDSLGGRFTDAHNYLFIMEWLHYEHEKDIADANAQEVIDRIQRWNGEEEPYHPGLA